MERCNACGYSYATLERGEMASEMRAEAQSYVALLGAADPVLLRRHGRVGVWSALEYACHARDVLRVQRGRILQACGQDRPEFASMRRDERAVEERYNAQEPAEVAGQITVAAGALGQTFDALDDAGWRRTGIYHGPTTEIRTVEWIGRHTVHELVHHRGDIGRLLDDGSCTGTERKDGRR